MSWLEDSVHDTSDGFSLEFGDATVASLTLGENLTITLTGGAHIAGRKPFRLFRRDSAVESDSWKLTDTSAVNQVMHRNIQEAIITREGALEITFDLANAEELKLIINYNNWQVRFSNGSSARNLASGGIELLPPDHTRK
jgi:hypothetical protein